MKGGKRRKRRKKPNAHSRPVRSLAVGLPRPPPLLAHVRDMRCSTTTTTSLSFLPLRPDSICRGREKEEKMWKAARRAAPTARDVALQSKASTWRVPARVNARACTATRLRPGHLRRKRLTPPLHPRARSTLPCRPQAGHQGPRVAPRPRREQGEP